MKKQGQRAGSGMSTKWNAGNSDPKARGLMEGVPPAQDRIVSAEAGDLSGSSFPTTLSAFRHQPELKATVNVRRGSGAPSARPPQRP